MWQEATKQQPPTPAASLSRDRAQVGSAPWHLWGGSCAASLPPTLAAPPRPPHSLPGCSPSPLGTCWVAGECPPPPSTCHPGVPGGPALSPRTYRNTRGRAGGMVTCSILLRSVQHKVAFAARSIRLSAMHLHAFLVTEGSLIRLLGTPYSTPQGVLIN